MLCAGHNVTMVNTMIANYTLASRNTTAFFITDQGTDSETMVRF
jgi:hypothetical protein